MEMKKRQFGGRDEIQYEDPAFALVSLSRVSHTYTGPEGMRGARLFGSDTDHQHYITLKISPGEVHRHLGQDWFHAKHLPFIEVAMSNTQFADLLTSFNMGSGVPATLIWKDGEHYKMPDMPTKVEQFKQELKDNLDEVTIPLKAAEAELVAALSSGKPLGKGAQDELLNKIRAFSRLVEDSLPFAAKQFQRQVDRSVNEAKANIEAYVTHTVNELGLERLEDLTKVLKLEQKKED